MNPSRRMLSLILLGGILSACDVVAPLMPLSTTRESLEQVFGPEYPPEPPVGGEDGGRLRIDSAELGPDGRTITVHFIGGPGYLASDPCSEDYEPWVGVVGIDLRVGIVSVPHPGDALLGPNEGCDAAGYSYTFHLRLPFSARGSTVRDLLTNAPLIEP